MYWWLYFSNRKCTLADCFAGSFEKCVLLITKSVSHWPPIHFNQGLVLRILWNVVICHQFSPAGSFFQPLLSWPKEYNRRGSLNFLLITWWEKFISSRFNWGWSPICLFNRTVFRRVKKVGQGKSQDFWGKTASWKHLYCLLLTSLMKEGFLLIKSLINMRWPNTWWAGETAVYINHTQSRVAEQHRMPCRATQGSTQSEPVGLWQAGFVMRREG